MTFPHAQKRIKMGIGILETLLALFIGALFLAGTILLYNHSRQERYVTEFHQEISMIYLAGRITSSNGNMGWQNTETLVKANVVPKKWVYQQTTFMSPWMSPVYMFGDTFQGVSAMRIETFDVPLSVCQSLTANSDGSVNTVINGTPIQRGASPGDLNTLCGTSPNRTVAFYFTH